MSDGMKVRKAQGLIIFVGALGLFCTMVATDIAQLQDWQSATNPPFVAKLIGYLGSVIASFIAGKIIPSEG